MSASDKPLSDEEIAKIIESDDFWADIEGTDTQNETDDSTEIIQTEKATP